MALWIHPEDLHSMSMGTINGIAFSGTQRAVAKSDKDSTPSNIPIWYWPGGHFSRPVFSASHGAANGHGEMLAVVGRGTNTWSVWMAWSSKEGARGMIWMWIGTCEKCERWEILWRRGRRLTSNRSDNVTICLILAKKNTREMANWEWGAVLLS